MPLTSGPHPFTLRQARGPRRARPLREALVSSRHLLSEALPPCALVPSTRRSRAAQARAKAKRRAADLGSGHRDLRSRPHVVPFSPTKPVGHAPNLGRVPITLQRPSLTSTPPTIQERPLRAPSSRSPLPRPRSCALSPARPTPLRLLQDGQHTTRAQRPAGPAGAHQAFHVKPPAQASSPPSQPQSSGSHRLRSSNVKTSPRSPACGVSAPHDPGRASERTTPIRPGHASRAR